MAHGASSSLSHAAPPLSHPTYRHTRRLIQEARGQGIALFFVFYPDFDLARGRFHDYAIQRAMMRFVRENGGAAVDLREAFRKRAKPERLYIPGDGHPSAAAARVFLEELPRYIPE